MSSEHINLEAKFKEEAQEEAELIAKSQKELIMPAEITGIEEDGDKRNEYLLIQDFLQSLNLETAPEVLRFESLHPKVEVDRKELAAELNLRSYDKTPLLVQLIAKRLAQIENK